MKIIANCNFLWYVKGQEVPESELDAHPNWKEFVTITGQPVTPIIEKPVSKGNPIDLNKDGNVDQKDAKIAGEVLRKVYPQKRRK